jgi:hypothetical protein
MIRPVKEIQKLSYETGFWTSQVMVVPFLNGFMDSLEPQIIDRIHKRILDKAIPSWMKGLFG